MAATSWRPLTGTPSARARASASPGSACALSTIALISVRCACRSRLSCCRVSSRPRASVLAARSISTVSGPVGGPSQARITRPQSSPRAPTVVTSQPVRSS